MGYLILQIISCLLAAFLLGFFIGWLLRGKGKDKEIENLQNISKANLYSREEELKAAKKALEECKSNLTNTEVKAVKPPVIKPVTSAVKAASPYDEKDDLKKIGGIGPYLEKILNENGIFTYRQIAGFTDKTIEELSQKIGSFQGRIRQDNWIKGAKEQHYKKYGEKL